MELQNNNVLERYLELGEKAEECDVCICDVYDKWKTLQKNGVNVTELLSNKINRPTCQMNWLFAYSLIETMMR